MAHSSVAAMMVVLIHLATFSFLQPFARNRLRHPEMTTKKTKQTPINRWNTHSLQPKLIVSKKFRFNKKGKLCKKISDSKDAYYL